MVELTRNVFVETSYDEVNVSAIVTPTGIICIDAPSYAQDARDWAGRVHRLSPYPVQQILLTDASGDRALNTRWLNAPIVMHRAAATTASEYGKKQAQSIIDNLVARNPKRGQELNNTYIEQSTMNFTAEIVMYKHSQPLILRHVGGPTNGNCWITLPEQSILFVGDTLTIGHPPHLAAPTSAAWIATLNELRPLLKTYTIVCGRGEATSNRSLEEAIDSCINYLTQMRAAVEDLHGNHGNIETIVDQFVAQYPLRSYPESWVRQQIRNSLDYVVDELQLEPI